MDASAADGRILSPIDDLIEHLRLRALRRDGPFSLRSGGISDWYLDARQTTFDGSGALLVGKVVLSMLESSIQAVGGMTMGADPVAVATAIAGVQSGRAMRAFSVRKSGKEHGLGGRLVGPIGRGDRVAVVEDTATTGAALSEAIDVLLSEGVVVVQAIAVCDRSGGVVAERLQARSIPFQAAVLPVDLGIE